MTTMAEGGKPEGMLEQLQLLFQQDLRDKFGDNSYWEIPSVAKQLVEDYVVPMINEVLQQASELTPGPFGTDMTELWTLLDPAKQINLAYVVDWEELNR